MGFEAPLLGEILRCEGGEWRSLGVVEQRDGFKVIDRRRSVPLADDLKTFRDSGAAAVAVFPAAGGCGHPALSRISLPVATDCDRL
jgi:hypothetical protein